MEMKQSRHSSQNSQPLISSNTYHPIADCGQDDSGSEIEVVARGQVLGERGQVCMTSAVVRAEKKDRKVVVRSSTSGRRRGRQQAKGLAILNSVAESLQVLQQHESSDLLVLKGTLDKQRCKDILVDAGASSNFVRLNWAQRHQLKVEQLTKALEVVLADGRVVSRPSGIVNVETATVNGSSAPCRLVVMDQLSHDVILGMPWLRKARVVLGCGDLLTWNGQPLSLSPTSASQSQLAAVKVAPAYEHVFAGIRRKYGSVFRNDLPRKTAREMKNAVHHVIRLTDPNCRPVVSKERRRSPKDVQTLRDAVEEMERAGLIEDSVSPWSAQAVLVPKVRDGVVLEEKRPCWDYRPVNLVTVADSQPLPLPEVLFDHLQGSQMFSKMDLTKGFWQIPLEKKSRELLAFSTPVGLKQPRFMPFGIKNAPATFQREMQRVLKDRLYKGVLAFIDDILIYSSTPEEHAQLVEFVLRRLKEEGYYAHPDKCEFFQKEVSFLGHVISAEGIRVQDYKVKAMREWPQPQSKTEVKSFLGLTGYYRKFIEGYSEIAVPLTELTREKVSFDWKQEHQDAFDRLKNVLVQAPVLAHANPELPYFIHTDASGFAVSAVLSQDQGNGRQPIAYWSRKMNDAQKKYPVHEQELLAIVLAVEHWRCYLSGSTHPVHVFTDHRSLQWLSTQPTLSHRQARWVEALQEFSFMIEYVEGKENKVADALSRRRDYEQEAERDAQKEKRRVEPQQRLQLILPLGSAATEHSNTISTNVDSSALLHRIKDAAVRDEEYQLRLKKAVQMGLKVKDGLLYTEDGILHLPHDMEVKSQILHEIHDTQTGGHLGMNKTLKKLRQRVYWHGMDRDVVQYVKSCVTCASTKPSQQLPAGKLVPLPIPHRPWETISIDFIGPLPKTDNYHDFILVVVDKFTKMAHFIPTNQEVTAKQTAKLVLREVVRLHGVPSQIISDRDPRFTSEFWKELWKQMGTQLKMSTSYHPQTDGQTERAIRVLEDMLRAYVSKHRTNWDELLTPVEIAYNSSEQASTGFTPFELNGGSAALPIDIALKTPLATDVQAVEDLISEVRQHLEDARLLLLKRQETQKKYADKRRREEKYEVGDEVMLSTKRLPAFSNKLTDLYTGPFRVIGVKGEVNVELDLPSSMKRLHPVFHVDKLKRYVRSAVEWPGREQQDRPPPMLVDGEEEYEIERIIGKREEEVDVAVADDPSAVAVTDDERLRRGARTRSRSRQQKVKKKVVKYLVKWKGWDDDQASWKADDELDHARELVEDYEHQQRVERGEESVAVMIINA